MGVEQAMIQEQPEEDDEEEDLFAQMNEANLKYDDDLRAIAA